MKTFKKKKVSDKEKANILNEFFVNNVGYVKWLICKIFSNTTAQDELDEMYNFCYLFCRERVHNFPPEKTSIKKWTEFAIRRAKLYYFQKERQLVRRPVHNHDINITHISTSAPVVGLENTVVEEMLMGDEDISSDVVEMYDFDRFYNIIKDYFAPEIIVNGRRKCSEYGKMTDIRLKDAIAHYIHGVEYKELVKGRGYTVQYLNASTITALGKLGKKLKADGYSLEDFI